MPKDYARYEVKVACSNCKWTKRLRILKGIQVEDTYCPKCRCLGTLSVVEKDDKEY